MKAQDEAMQRVARRRAARRLLQAWLQFTPCELTSVSKGTVGDDGTVLLTAVLKVSKADVDKELVKAALKLPDDSGEGYA